MDSIILSVLSVILSITIAVLIVVEYYKNDNPRDFKYALKIYYWVFGIGIIDFCIDVLRGGSVWLGGLDFIFIIICIVILHKLRKIVVNTEK